MSRRLSFPLTALLALAAFAIAPSVALARSHWSIGIGFPGVSIGYSDYGRHGHGWGGNYYGGYGGYAGYYAPIHHRPVYYGAYSYGPSYYGPSYYGPAYHAPVSYSAGYYYSRPAAVVYYDREPVRYHRTSRRHADGYRDHDRDDGYRRASYYDRDAEYRR
jgi:hypothetical protein